ncbi:MAG: hypothetical protein FWD66_07145 [Paludibacter sp.]|nr:hypothetical protein [Paludibacter sp.]
MKKTVVFLIICALAAGFSSCKKDEPDKPKVPKNEIKIGNESFPLQVSPTLSDGISHYGVDDWETASLDFQSTPNFQAGGAAADLTIELVYKINKGFSGTYICEDGLFAELPELESQGTYHVFTNGFTWCHYDVPMNPEQSKTYYIKSGTVTITDLGNNTYSVVCDLIAEDNTAIGCTYTGKFMQFPEW